MFFDVFATDKTSKPAEQITAAECAEMRAFYAAVAAKREEFALWAGALDAEASTIAEPKVPSDETLAILIERGALKAQEFATVGATDSDDDDAQEVSAQ